MIQSVRQDITSDLSVADCVTGLYALSLIPTPLCGLPAHGNSGVFCNNTHNRNKMQVTNVI